MTRKSDFLRSSIIFLSPHEIFEVEPENVVTDDGIVSVHFVRKRMSERSKVQLSPVDVTLSSLLLAGTVIEPSSFVSSLGFTEVSELEDSKSRLSSEMLSYLTEHENEIKKFVSENNIK